jgi:hypothetical protein
MSARLIVANKMIVNGMSGRQFGRAIILEAGMRRSLQSMSGSLLVRVKTVLPVLLMRV